MIRSRSLISNSVNNNLNSLNNNSGNSNSNNNNSGNSNSNSNNINNISNSIIQSNNNALGSPLIISAVTSLSSSTSSSLTSHNVFMTTTTEKKEIKDNTSSSSSTMCANPERNIGGGLGLGSNRKGIWRYCLIILSICLSLYAILIFVSPRPLKEHENKLHVSKDQITVVINTFRRYDMMQDAVEFYASCELTKFIYVIWSDNKPPPQRITAKYANIHHPKITFDQQPIDSLNNRFKPITSGDHTDCIFAVDDDMRVSCNDLSLAYEVWRSSKKSLVGFMPRIHLRGLDGKYIYRCWWRVWWHGVYSMILTKAALLHHDYLDMYTNIMPQSIRNLVDKDRNCEDIAMQFLIANHTQLPPIYVKGHVEDLGALNGISTSKNVATAGHMDKRSQCLNDLTTIYGGKMPLIPSHFIVDSASNGWTNAPSSWWEFISSDLWKL